MSRLLAFLGCMWASGVSAQGVYCGPYQVHVQGMEAAGSEAIFSGMSERGNRVEVWVNRNKDIWLVLDVRPSGVACVLDSGKGLLKVRPAGIKG